MKDFEFTDAQLTSLRSLSAQILALENQILFVGLNRNLSNNLEELKKVFEKLSTTKDNSNEIF